MPILAASDVKRTSSFSLMPACPAAAAISESPLADMGMVSLRSSISPLNFLNPASSKFVTFRTSAIADS